ncbi:hypothetical protein [Ktedonobacter racemifer]|uniref:Glycosyltransferase RgtA/B/C/D-like domain-containing protein n=1 Tax=Ktedonobacter racemifer DSM 44963 TaxID=485913 RepID=D6TZ26_KTERA|nr:hypothetical protein [Ktedonobacter racemifer]EFH81816.1 hypothetical protein Krac_2568 [Ktedonobacter racemifer DSM 44963]
MLSEKQAGVETRLSYYLGAFLLLIIIGVVGIYYLNAPFVEFGPDTYGYLGAVHQLQTTGNPVNYFRLPTYSIFILGVYAFTHQGNLMAVSIVQGILFICAVAEIYLLTLLITRRPWIAFLVGLLVGTNIFLLYSAKLIMAEGLSLWLLTTVMLNAIVFLKTLRPLFLWISSGCLLFLLFARPEWVLFPCLLFLILIVFTWKKLPRRTIALPVISSLAVMYLLIGGYIYANARINNVASLSTVTNMNLIGKVLQYRMQDETPYNPYLSHIYDDYLRQGHASPFYIASHAPGIGDHYAQASADWAKNIILHHPVEFLMKSVPLFFTSLYYYPAPSIPHIAPGKFVNIINPLLLIQLRLSTTNILFPLCALIWLTLCCYRKTRHAFGVQTMGLLVLTVVYAVIITTLGSYSESEYPRIHVIFDPLITLVVWGSFGLGIYQLLSFLRGRKKAGFSR